MHNPCWDEEAEGGREVRRSYRLNSIGGKVCAEPVCGIFVAVKVNYLETKAAYRG